MLAQRYLRLLVLLAPFISACDMLKGLGPSCTIVGDLFLEPLDSIELVGSGEAPQTLVVRITGETNHPEGEGTWDTTGTIALEQEGETTVEASTST